jgi:hypothetical protein
MKVFPIIPGLFVITSFAALPVLSKAQSLLGAPVSAKSVDYTTSFQLDLTYKRPNEGTKIHRYLFDAFGRYPIASAAITAGIGQAVNSPPEWRRGAEGYRRRFVSDWGIAAVGTTTVMHCRRPSGKTHCITAAIARASCPG